MGLFDWVALTRVLCSLAGAAASLSHGGSLAVVRPPDGCCPSPEFLDLYRRQSSRSGVLPLPGDWRRGLCWQSTSARRPSALSFSL